MMNFRKINNLTTEEKSLIETFLSKSSSANLFSTLKWQKITSKISNNNVIVAFFFRFDELIALMFMEEEKKYGLLKYYYSPPRRSETPYGGPIVIDSFDKKLFVPEMINLLKKTRNSYFNITFPPSFDIDDSASVEVSKICGLTSLIDTDKGIEELYSNFKRNCRGHINSAKRYEIKVESGGLDKLDAFYRILKENYSKKDLLIQDFSFYKKVINTFYPDNSKIFLAKLDDKYIGGVFLLQSNDQAYYWLGSNLKKFNNKNPGSLIQWQIIKDLSENKFKSYDLLNLSIPSIARFKRGFGGKDYPFNTLVFRTGILEKVNKIKGIFIR